MQNKFSFFRAPIRNVVPSREMSVHEVYEYVMSDVVKERTGVLCGLQDRKMQQQYKGSKLDYVTPSAVVTRRGSGGLIAHSGLVVMDIDHIASEEELQRVKSLLVADELLRPVLIFRSPSGDGLKVWYRLFPAQINYLNDPDASDVHIIEAHKYFYESIVEYLRRKYAIIADATSDVMRACYLCYDPEAYFNEERGMGNEECHTGFDLLSTNFRVQLKDNLEVQNNSCLSSISVLQPTGHGTPCPYKEEWDTVEALVRGIEQAGVDITGDYHQWMRIGFSLASAFGESGRGFYHRVSRFYSGYSNVECNRQYDRCLRARGSGVGLGTFIYLAKAV